MNSRLSSTLALCVILLTSFVISASAYGRGKHEPNLFLSGLLINNASDHDPAIDGSDFVPKADFIYSYTNNRVRLLGEYLYSSEESELERFLVGWEANDETLIWAGRFHMPANAWNTIYHHGQYMQTSISRPGLAEFEDKGGSLPSHSTGLLISTGGSFTDGSGIKLSISFGTAPMLGEEGVEPLDILDPDSGHGLSGSTRIAYFPDYLGETQIGLTVGATQMKNSFTDNTAAASLGDIDQLNIGSYMDWQLGDYRIISNILYVQNEFPQQPASDEHYWMGYMQVEYNAHNDWNVYSRYEDSSNYKNSPYLKLIPNFTPSRLIGGVRYDFIDKHAVTLEFGKVETISDDFSQIMLQWSMVLR